MSTAAVVHASFSRPRVDPRSPRLRLTQRGRVVLTSLAATPLVIIVLVVVFGGVLGGGQATASLSGSATTFQYLTVGSGESLWQIAQQLAPASDPRDVIAEIRQLNRLESADVFAGQQLAVPARYSR